MIRIIALSFFLFLPQKIVAEPEDTFHFVFFGSHLKKEFGHVVTGRRG